MPSPMKSNCDYPYARGELLSDRNTYFYSVFGGSAFLSAWKFERASVFSTLPPGRPAPSASSTSPPMGNVTIDTGSLLEYLYEAATQGQITHPQAGRYLDQIIKKFEVTKRVHQEYDANFKAIDKELHHNLELYVRLGEVFELAYAKTRDIRLLNVFLKVMDTVCSFATELVPVQQARLSTLIEAEQKFVMELCSDAELPCNF